MGENLEREELNAFMELASEPWSDRPGLIDIKRIARILVPNVKTEAMMAE